MYFESRGNKVGEKERRNLVVIASKM
jgi:hypothetical protein